jgi:hypothetical protein
MAIKICFGSEAERTAFKQAHPEVSFKGDIEYLDYTKIPAKINSWCTTYDGMLKTAPTPTVITPPTYYILKGVAKTTGGSPLQGVKVVAFNLTTTTDFTGNYYMQWTQGWSGYVYASLDGYVTQQKTVTMAQGYNYLDFVMPTAAAAPTAPAPLPVPAAPAETALQKQWREFFAQPSIMGALGLVPSSVQESFSRVFSNYSIINAASATPRSGDYVAVGLILAGLSLATLGTVSGAISLLPSAVSISPVGGTAMVLPALAVGGMPTAITAYSALDAALAANDAFKVKNALTNAFTVDTASIRDFIKFITNGKVISAIIGALGSMTFAKFLYEERIQVAQYSGITAKAFNDYAGMQAALDLQKEVLNRPLLEQLVEWIPVANLVQAVQKFWESSTKALAINQAALDKKLGIQPINPNASLDKAAAAVAAGQDPTPYLPDTGMTGAVISAPEVFKISITSTPTNGKVYIDNVYTHHLTPSNQAELSDVMRLLAPGQHVIMVTKSVKNVTNSATKTVNITSGDNGSIDLVLAPPGLGEPAAPAPVVALPNITNLTTDQLRQLRDQINMTLGVTS